MSSSSRGAAGITVGVLAVATLPAAVASSWLVHRVTLLHALEAGVPIAFVLGLIAVSLIRRARYRVERSVARSGARAVRFGRFLAWTGVYLAVTGAIALGFYGLLVVRG